MAPVTMPTPELEFGKRAENCVTDGLIKLGGGLVLGSVLSVLFFKRRRWPVILGGGFGVGVAWSNCTKDFNALTSSAKPKVNKTNFTSLVSYTQRPSGSLLSQLNEAADMLSAKLNKDLASMTVMLQSLVADSNVLEL